jgi:hypothetical protein
LNPTLKGFTHAIEESCTHINITKKIPTSNPTFIELEKWMALITRFVTFNYIHTMHKKFILGFLEKNIQILQKKHKASQLTKCKWQLKGKMFHCIQI